MSLHAFFGWGQGTAAICLGGGHDHPQHVDQVLTDELETSCEDGCDHSHRSSSPAGVVADDHHHHDHHDQNAHCGCTDVELTFLGHLAILRDDLTESTLAVPAPQPLLVVAFGLSSDRDRGSLIEAWDDPAIQNQLIQLRSTRINV